MPSSSSIPHEWIASVLVRELRNELNIDSYSEDEDSNYSDANSTFGVLTQTPAASQRYRCDGSNSRFKHIPDLPQTNVQVVRFEDLEQSLQAIVSDGTSEITARFTQAAVDQHPKEKFGAFGSKSLAILALRKFEIVIDHCLADDTRRIQLLVTSFKCLQTLPSILGQPRNVVHQPHVLDLCQKLLDQRKDDKGNKPSGLVSKPQLSAEAAQLLDLLKPSDQIKVGSSPLVDHISTSMDSQHHDKHISSTPPGPSLVKPSIPAFRIRWGEIFEDIPEDQADILKKPSSWYKPAPGQTFPTANVPATFLALFRGSLSATEQIKQVTELQNALPRATPVQAPVVASLNEDADSESGEIIATSTQWPPSQDASVTGTHESTVQNAAELPSSTAGLVHSVGSTKQTIDSSPHTPLTAHARPGQIFARSLSPISSMPSSSPSPSPSSRNSVDMHNSLAFQSVEVDTVLMSKGTNADQHYRTNSLPPESSDASSRRQTPMIEDSWASNLASGSSPQLQTKASPEFEVIPTTEIADYLDKGTRTAEARVLVHGTAESTHPLLDCDNTAFGAQLASKSIHELDESRIPEDTVRVTINSPQDELKRKRREDALSPHSSNQIKKPTLVKAPHVDYLMSAMQEQKRSRMAFLTSDNSTKDEPTSEDKSTRQGRLVTEKTASVHDRKDASHRRKGMTVLYQQGEEAANPENPKPTESLQPQPQNPDKSRDDGDPRPLWFKKHQSSQASSLPRSSAEPVTPSVDMLRPSVVSTLTSPHTPASHPSSQKKSRRSLPWAASQPARSAPSNAASEPSLGLTKIRPASSMPSLASSASKRQRSAADPIAQELTDNATGAPDTGGNEPETLGMLDKYATEREPQTSQGGLVTNDNRDQPWYRDANTPFKTFARNMVKLKCYQREDGGTVFDAITTKPDGEHKRSHALPMDVLSWQLPRSLGS